MRGLIVPLADTFLALEPMCRETFNLRLKQDASDEVLCNKHKECCSLIKHHMVVIGKALEQTVCFFPYSSVSQNVLTYC